MLFDTKDIYIGTLGVIYYNDKDPLTRYIEEKKAYSIFYLTDNKTAVDVFSKREYLIWKQCEFEDVADKCGYQAIDAFMPIEKFLYEQKEKVSLDELEMVYYRAVNKDKDKNEYPKDLILKCIYETYLFLDSLDIELDEKNKYIISLKELSRNYIKEISILKKNNSFNSNFEISEQSIRIKYLTSIIKIEDELRHLDNINLRNLKMDEKKLESRMVL